MYLKEKVIRNARMHIRISDVEDRVRTLLREHCDALHKVRCTELQVTRPHLPKTHIIKILKPQ